MDRSAHSELVEESADMSAFNTEVDDMDLLN